MVFRNLCVVAILTKVTLEGQWFPTVAPLCDGGFKTCDKPTARASKKWPKAVLQIWRNLSSKSIVGKVITGKKLLRTLQTSLLQTFLWYHIQFLIYCQKYFRTKQQFPEKTPIYTQRSQNRPDHFENILLTKAFFLKTFGGDMFIWSQTTPPFQIFFEL